MAALGYLGGGAGRGPGRCPTRRAGRLARATCGRHRAMAQKDYAGRPGASAGSPPTPRWPTPGSSSAAPQRLGDRDAALAAFREALRLGRLAARRRPRPRSTLRRLQDAEPHARMAMASSPSFAHGLLAQIALERGDSPTAEREARRRAEKGVGSARSSPSPTCSTPGPYEEALARIARRRGSTGSAKPRTPTCSAAST